MELLEFCFLSKDVRRESFNDFFYRPCESYLVIEEYRRKRERYLCESCRFLSPLVFVGVTKIAGIIFFLTFSLAPVILL